MHAVLNFGYEIEIPPIDEGEIMKTAILALNLFLLLSFSAASAQVSKMTVGYGALSAVKTHTPPSA